MPQCMVIVLHMCIIYLHQPFERLRMSWNARILRVEILLEMQTFVMHKRNTMGKVVGVLLEVALKNIS